MDEEKYRILHNGNEYDITIHGRYQIGIPVKKLTGPVEFEIQDFNGVKIPEVQGRVTDWTVNGQRHKTAWPRAYLSFWCYVPLPEHVKSPGCTPFCTDAYGQWNVQRVQGDHLTDHPDIAKAFYGEANYEAIKAYWPKGIKERLAKPGLIPYKSIFEQ